MAILLDLVGGVSLLLWGLYMVESGIVHAFGPRIRHFFATFLKNRFFAFLAGLGVTTAIQSSTATALMITSFSTSGLMPLPSGLAVMLGANVGTTLIVQLLSFDSSAIAPLLLVIGVIAFKRGGHFLSRDLGRVSIGLGLMLLSLHLLLDSFATVEKSEVMHQLFAALTGEPVMTLLIGAGLTWAAHSSVATVLLAMSLVSSNLISPPAALAFVLGANLGSAINPLIEGPVSGNPASRRLPIGNLVNRIVGCIIFLPFLDISFDLIQKAEISPVRVVADFHTLFNIIMAAAFIVPLHPFARLLERLLPDIQSADDPSKPMYLDERVVETPSVALAYAARETMHMADIIDDMLEQTMTALLTNDRQIVTQVRQKDDIVDQLQEAIKLYVIKVTRGVLDHDESRRAMDILGLSINLEHIGDIIDKNLLEIATKKINHQLQFSVEGAAELKEFHRIIHDNLKLSMTVFLNGDVKSARLLLAEKSRVRDLEIEASENHLNRLREGRIESIETSAVHLDILRDLKRIHSHICSTAYPALEDAGQLRKSRLRPVKDK